MVIMNWNKRYSISKELQVSYHSPHSAPNPLNGQIPLHEAYPHLKEYLSGIEEEPDDGPDGDVRRGRAGLEIARQVYKNPNALVKIYREVPKGVVTINPRDWITTVKYESRSFLPRDGSGTTLEKIVPAKHLYTELGNGAAPDGDQIPHCGYFPS
jgi:hypothetical protein